jgi:3-hydroxybutyrate dehydrogenase
MTESVKPTDATIIATTPAAAPAPAPKTVPSPALRLQAGVITPDYSLIGRVAIVTGSSTRKGIGLGIVRALAEKGANIVLNGLGDAAVIESIRAEIEADFGVTAIYHGANLAKPDEIYDLVKTTVAKFGRIDIVVNNAGIQHVAPIVDFPDDKYRAIIDINQNSAWYLCKAALPYMKDWGRVINIASAHGLVGSKNKSAYVMSKHAIVGMTKSLGLEYARTPVRFTAICPGWVYTDLVIAQIKKLQAEKGFATYEEAERDLLGEKEPTLKFTTVEELGGIAVFLCSEHAKNITADTISCDGGWTAE